MRHFTKLRGMDHVLIIARFIPTMLREKKMCSELWRPLTSLLRQTFSVFVLPSCWWTPGARASGWPSKLAVHIKSSLDLCSYGRAGAVALYLKSDDLWLRPSSLADLITRPAFGTRSRDFPQWEGERDRTSGCQDNWQRHLDHTAGMTEWHSLPLIVFPPSLCHSLPFSFSPSRSPTRSLFFFFHLVCVFALISPPAVTPRVPRPMSPWRCYPWHLRDKVTPGDWWPRVHAEMSCHL